MKHNFEHYVSIFLYIWLVLLAAGSLALFCWVVKVLLKLIGVI